MDPEHQHISALNQMVDEVLTDCVEQFFGGNTHAALEAFRQGRADLCQTFTDLLGAHLAAYLADLEPGVESVYRYRLDPDGLRALEEDLAWRFHPGVHLVVWVREKDEVFAETVAALEDCLRQTAREKGVCSDETNLPLEIHLVDEREVCAQAGYGIFAAGDLIRSEKIWPRQERTTRTARAGEGDSDRGPLLEELATFDPKMAPEARILDHARSIAAVPRDQRGALEYHLTELKVNLIRKLISDQLRYLNIARTWFEIEDLEDLYQRRIGSGKIGGKAAGMTLAYRILREAAGDQVRKTVRIPESYFLGSDLIYVFMAMNGLMHWNDQKYKPEEDIRGQYNQIQSEFLAGEFPPEILARLKSVLEKLGDAPIIVRSSSQLEDNFGTAFAGKYDSFFLANQGTPEENLQALTEAVSRIYASTLKPEALLYRRRRGLQDYDERMAVLIQQVQGERFGKYYLPDGAGVAFSRNLYRWSPEIRPDEGFVRLVFGLGTRAVGRVSEDYPRLIALSHPQLQPDDSAQAVLRYSQHQVDLIDLEANQPDSLPVEDVLTSRHPALRYLVEIDQGGYLAAPRMRVREEDLPRAALTFQNLITGTAFVEVIREMLEILECHYHDAVDLEFTLRAPRKGKPLQLSLLQCRPQPRLSDVYDVELPVGLPAEEIVLGSSYLVPRGYLPDVRQVIYVDPAAYYALETPAQRTAVGRVISQLNELLEPKRFIFVGPGRWGSTNPDLGVFVSYADIHRAGALVEVAGRGIGPDPDPSLGTHFFQDLMEAEIYPLAVNLDHPETIFNADFFHRAENALEEYLEVEPALKDCVRVIEVETFQPGAHLEIVMDDRENRTLAYLVRD
jgi:hypothetical protein